MGTVMQTLLGRLELDLVGCCDCDIASDFEGRGSFGQGMFHHGRVAQGICNPTGPGNNPGYRLLESSVSITDPVPMPSPLGPNTVDASMGYAWERP